MTKAQLISYRQCKIEVEQIRGQLKRLESVYYPKAQALTGLPRSHGDADDALVAFVEKKSALEDMLRARLYELLQLQTEVEAAIETLQDATERNIMRLHYIDGIRFDDVAALVGYDVRQVYRIKKHALDAICQCMSV